MKAQGGVEVTDYMALFVAHVSGYTINFLAWLSWSYIVQSSRVRQCVRQQQVDIGLFYGLSMPASGIGTQLWRLLKQKLQNQQSCCNVLI